MKKNLIRFFRLSDLVMQLCTEIEFIVLLTLIALHADYKVLTNGIRMVLKSIKARINLSGFSLGLFVSIFNLVKPRFLSLEIVIFPNTFRSRQAPT
ncbi:MAG TPA: hypothetical protein GXX38_01250 [Clostridia bacterium]|jgi:hypothetical protein|nr:hypothetical protein [Clostridia bacterium]